MDYEECKRNLNEKNVTNKKNATIVAKLRKMFKNCQPTTESVSELLDLLEDEDITKKTTEKTSYEIFLETLPDQINAASLLLKKKTYTIYMIQDISVRFTMQWDTEFDQIGLFDIELLLPSLLDTLLQTDNYELVDDIILKTFLEKTEYGPYIILQTKMTDLIKSGDRNEQKYSGFDWTAMVLEPAELLVNEKNNE